MGAKLNILLKKNTKTIYPSYGDIVFRITESSERYKIQNNTMSIQLHVCNGEEINTVFKILYSDLYEMTVKLFKLIRGGNCMQHIRQIINLHEVLISVGVKLYPPANPRMFLIN